MKHIEANKNHEVRSRNTQQGLRKQHHNNLLAVRDVVFVTSLVPRATNLPAISLLTTQIRNTASRALSYTLATPTFVGVACG